MCTSSSCAPIRVASTSSIRSMSTTSAALFVASSAFVVRPVLSSTHGDVITDAATTFNACPVTGICRGTVVVISPGGKIVFAGPHNMKPPARDGNMVCMSPVDFKLLQTIVAERRH